MALVKSLAAALAATVLASPAIADTWPSKPITPVSYTHLTLPTKA